MHDHHQNQPQSINGQMSFLDGDLLPCSFVPPFPKGSKDRTSIGIVLGQHSLPASSPPFGFSSNLARPARVFRAVTRGFLLLVKGYVDVFPRARSHDRRFGSVSVLVVMGRAYQDGIQVEPLSTQIVIQAAHRQAFGTLRFRNPLYFSGARRYVAVRKARRRSRVELKREISNVAGLPAAAIVVQVGWRHAAQSRCGHIAFHRVVC